MAADDVAGALIAALGEEGEYVDDGRFTLDAAKAQTKLRSFQLSDPHAYLLLLVEAAWLGTRGRSEALRSSIEITTGRTTEVVFDGPSFSKQALGNLFGAALGDTTGVADQPVAARVLQLIGLAANTALALEPRELIVEVTDPSGARHRARVDADTVEVETLREDSSSVHAVCVRLVGATLDRARPLAEAALVRERCQLSSLEIRVDGERVSHGPNHEFDEQGARETIFVDQVAVGALGFDPDFPVAKARIINRGVEVESLRLQGPEGLLAVVEVDLPMDLSRSQLSRGPELRALERGIAAAVRRLPASGRPINWQAIQTGDGRLLVFFAVLALACLALALALAFLFVGALGEL